MERKRDKDSDQSFGSRYLSQRAEEIWILGVLRACKQGAWEEKPLREAGERLEGPERVREEEGPLQGRVRVGEEF